MKDTNRDDIYVEMLKKQYELNNELATAVKHLGSISEAMKTSLDQQNIEIKNQTNSLILNTEAVKINTTAVGKLESGWLKLIIFLVSAICVLAIGKDAFSSIGQ